MATPTQAPCLRHDAVAVAQTLRDAGHVAYFAGGCVRDELMGHVPKDYDVATDAPPDRVQQLFRRTQAVGAAFGVILVRQGASTVEVATFRTDASYEDGRRPTAVHFATAKEDAQRRDFTINGLFLHPTSGEVIDYVGGRSDLAAGIVRAIGQPEERFAEDHLRLLRAVRFTSRFGFTLDDATRHAIVVNATKLAHISPERIAGELRLMLTPSTRSHAVRLLEEVQLLPVLVRYLHQPSPPQLQVFDHLGDEDLPFGLALAALVLAHRKLHWPLPVHQDVAAMRQTFRISNAEEGELLACLLADRLLTDDEHPVATLKRFAASPHAGDVLRLLRALAASGVYSGQVAALQGRVAGLVNIAPPPLINGEDLRAAGLTPGPLFKRVLHQVYDAQLEDRISTADEAMMLARQIAETDSR